MDKKLKLPKIGEHVRNVGKLVAVESIQPPAPKPYKLYIFEEREARCELRLGSEVLKHIETLNDFYGLGSGVKTAIEEMKEYAAKRNLTGSSELEVVVVKITRQYRKMLIERDNMYQPGYASFGDLPDYMAQKGLPEPVEEIAWSSKEPNESH